jgi:hypothetical protein
MMDDGFMRYNRSWTGWKRHFAYFPKRLVIKDYVTVGALQYRMITKTQWIWLKPYWERCRVDIYYNNNRSPIEFDYALTVFDILKKS